MTRWPEHTPEPGERQNWWPWIAGAVAAGIFVLMQGGLKTQHWRLPEFSMPQISPPQAQTPSVDQSEPTKPPSDGAALPGLEALNEALSNDNRNDDGITHQAMPFDVCVSMIGDSAQTLGQPTILEDTPTRRVATFKFAGGNLTITCADGQMTMEQG